MEKKAPEKSLQRREWYRLRETIPRVEGSEEGAISVPHTKGDHAERN